MMRFVYRTFAVIVLIFLVTSELIARHIAGGDLSMKALNNAGLFRIEMNQYWDDFNSTSGNQDASVLIYIYSKRTNQLVESISVSRQTTSALTYGNDACAKLRNLKVTRARYWRDYQFDVSKYTEAEGYYAVWERCCRNDDINNMTGTFNGMVFYMEFPAMQRSGAAFVNSSPEFTQPNGEYICVNKPFKMDFSATDADGDQLRYSLQTPIKGYTNQQQTNGTSAPKSSYPLIDWSSGYSAQNAIPGNPALRVDPATGQISVTASQVGLFLFTVQVEEFRNGVRIGVVRRDFQLPVVDCSRNIPPPAVVRQNNVPVRTVNWCSTQPLVLTVDSRPEWAYQWQLNGDNLPDAKTSSYTVKQSGQYTVITSFAGQCAGDTVSLDVKVSLNTGPQAKLKTSHPTPPCEGQTVTLNVETDTANTNLRYRWQRNGQVIANESRPQLSVKQPGRYAVQVQLANADCLTRDSIEVSFSPLPQASLRAASSSFCGGDSVQLQAATGTDFGYEWSLDGQVIPSKTATLYARQPGTYTVKVLTTAGCSDTASTTITQLERPSSQMDEIPVLCGSASQTYALRGQPASGVFAGPGVSGDQFDPAKAGPGRHKITYTITAANGCKAETSRIAEVTPALQITAPSPLMVLKRDSVQINTTANLSQVTYRWEPPQSLSDPATGNPMASPADTITYRLTASAPGGCTATAEVTVYVINKLYIPDAFSPNGDGRNDNWVIQNIGAFPACEVVVFNRWGEVVYYSKGYEKPWDGFYRNERIQAGLYTYQIRTGASGPGNHAYRGQLIILN